MVRQAHHEQRYKDFAIVLALTRTHFPQTVIASAARQSRRGNERRSWNEIAIRQRRTSLLLVACQKQDLPDLQDVPDWVRRCRRMISILIGLTQLDTFTSVIPAKAGIQCANSLATSPMRSWYGLWTPAFAGMTVLRHFKCVTPILIIRQIRDPASDIPPPESGYA